jgi:hypothetical protein
MRKTVLLAAMMSIVALMLAASPAMADDFDRHDFCHFFFDCNDRFDFDDGFGDFDQDADSGDIDQSFDVTGGGDNSNQSVGIQGVANTGNAQNQIGVTEFGDGFDNFDRDRFDRFFFDRFDGDDGDFGFEDSGASIEVSPENSTMSDQQINQAASAKG